MVSIVPCVGYIVQNVIGRQVAADMRFTYERILTFSLPNFICRSSEEEINLCPAINQ